MIDVDGTLVDSVPDLAYCVDEMMVELGMEKEVKTKFVIGSVMACLNSLKGQLLASLKVN